jgi:Mor family transcriptional regulator
MKVHELLTFNKELLSRLINAGVKPEDYRYVELFREYELLKGQGEKVTYIVAFLAQKYRISERNIYAITARMARDVTVQPLQQ